MKFKSLILLLTLLVVITGSIKIHGASLPRLSGYASMGKSDLEGGEPGWDNINYFAGVQVLAFYGFPVFLGYGYGLDAGYIHFSSGEDSGSGTDYFRTVPYFEFVLASVTLQVGTGPYRMKGGNTSIGFMLNWGFTIPMDPFYLHLMGKTEWIQAEEAISTFGFQLGFSYLMD